LTTAVQQRLGVGFEQWAMSTDAHLETPSSDYSIEVECRAAELDAETVSSLQDLFNRMSTDMARPREPSSALTLYRARANESRSEPPVGSALEWLEAAIPDLSVRSIYINLDKGTLSKADDFLHGLTFTYRQTTLAERIGIYPFRCLDRCHPACRHSNRS
jgi:hypothetical protein